MTTYKRKRPIAGRTIFEVELTKFDDGRGGQTYTPIIHFTNGTSIQFKVVETETQYGIEIIDSEGTI